MRVYADKPESVQTEDGRQEYVLTCESCGRRARTHYGMAPSAWLWFTREGEELPTLYCAACANRGFRPLVLTDDERERALPMNADDEPVVASAKVAGQEPSRRGGLLGACVRAVRALSSRER